MVLHSDRICRIMWFLSNFYRNCVQVVAEIESEVRMDPSKVIAMTDVDPGYFTELSGRSVREKFSLKQYMLDTQEVLRTRLLIGEKKDDCIRIDQQFEQESYRLQQIEV